MNECEIDMVIAGDVAIARGDQFQFEGFDSALCAKKWVFNMEGAIIGQAAETPSSSVYNDSDVLKQLSRFSLGPFFLANNHIDDVDQGVKQTIDFLQSLHLQVFGAGLEEIAAAAPVDVVSGEQRYRLLGFGWHVVGCQPASSSKPGVNAFEAEHVLKSARRAFDSNQGARLIVIVHGNFESERYLQPGHRKLARQLIDIGCHAVVFHHPHVVGPVERYRGKLIAHSVGNWAFSHGRFLNGRLRLSSATFHQIAVEFDGDSAVIHHADYQLPNFVKFLRSESVNSPEFSLRPVFENFGDDEYRRWFKENRIKKMGLPVYSTARRTLLTLVFDTWVLMRQRVISALFLVGIKKYAGASRPAN